MKKISKVVVFYDDGTFEELNQAAPKEETKFDPNKVGPAINYPLGVRDPGYFTFWKNATTPTSATE